MGWIDAIVDRVILRRANERDASRKEYMAAVEEIKGLKEEYKQEMRALQAERLIVAKELQEVRDSELRCMQRLIDVNTRVRDLAEEVIVLRDWQNNRPQVK